MKPVREELALAQAVVSAAAAAASMVYHAVKGDGPFQPELLVFAVAAVYGVWLRFKVTPVANPRDNQGRPLTPERPEPLPPRIDQP